MKEHMYTYHYFKKRGIIKQARLADYLFNTILVITVAYVLIMIISSVK